MRHYFVFLDSQAMRVSERALWEFKLLPYQQITERQVTEILFFMSTEVIMQAALQNVEKLVKRVTQSRLKFCNMYLKMGRFDKHLTECVLDPFRLRH